MTVANTEGTTTATRLDLLKKKKGERVYEIVRMKRGRYFLLDEELIGTTVGRTVWTVSVTRMEVGLPDIWVGEKVTIAVVVVNELVIPWMNAVEEERSVVLA